MSAAIALLEGTHVIAQITVVCSYMVRAQLKLFDAIYYVFVMQVRLTFQPLHIVLYAVL